MGYNSQIRKCLNITTVQAVGVCEHPDLDFQGL